MKKDPNRALDEWKTVYYCCKNFKKESVIHKKIEHVNY